MGAPKEVQTPGEFKCELCELSAPYTYYGWTLPNSTQLFLVTCQRKIKQQNPKQSIFKDCNLFYSKSFCLPYVKENLNGFPLEIKEDRDKRKPQQKSCKKNGYKA